MNDEHFQWHWAIFFGFILTFVSCTSIINPEDCLELERVEVYSIGGRSILFPISQSEEDVRENHQNTITDSLTLRKIELVLKEIYSCREEEKELGSIMLICDFYCKDGGMYTLINDKFSTRINDSFYCENADLIDELRWIEKN